MAICPIGAPFQETVSPNGKTITALNGPEFVIDPTSPAVKAVRDSTSEPKSFVLAAMELTGVTRICNHYCIDVEETSINNSLYDRSSQDWEQQLVSKSIGCQSLSTELSSSETNRE